MLKYNRLFSMEQRFGVWKVALRWLIMYICLVWNFIGVDRRTPNNLGYGEVGRFPIQINTSVRCVRYWLKLPIVYVCVRLLIRVSPSVSVCLCLCLCLSICLSVCLSVSKSLYQCLAVLSLILRVYVRPMLCVSLSHFPSECLYQCLSMLLLIVCASVRLLIRVSLSLSLFLPDCLCWSSTILSLYTSIYTSIGPRFSVCFSQSTYIIAHSACICTTLGPCMCLSCSLTVGIIIGLYDYSLYVYMYVS